ncbi:uncharacterized protein LOC141612504 [Silene latifolia]|uniref:uncharacterized protein LOC141612504 n=1 Tax=Silene latifolia TaxID=37657 RepID=UPI003D76BBD0
MDRKRSREESPKFNKHILKIAVARASNSVVSIVSHDVPAEMAKKLRRYVEVVPPPKEFIFSGSGFIIECNTCSSSDKPSTSSPRSRSRYLCTVLAPACLFKRPDDVPLDTIKIDVFGSTGVLYKAKLLACDFHYNLALITFKSTSLLQAVTFKGINDILSIDTTHQLQSREVMTFHLQSHSSLFKVIPGTEIFSVWRTHSHHSHLYPGCSFFRSKSPKGFGCNELYNIKEDIYTIGLDGGPALNTFGEVIGIIFNKSSFLPSNIITRWWNHYKSSREFRRPFLGVEVLNLPDAGLKFLSQFINKFPNISTAVIVTKVEEDSPASCSGIHTNDVIVKLDDKLVKSKLQFYETIWEKAGKSVELNVLRVTGGEELNMSIAIEETSPEKFHQWPHPCWNELR